MKSPILVLVISLPEATERRGRLLDRLEDLCIDRVQVMRAVIGAALDEEQRQAVYDDESMRCHAGRSMTAGELGCALSHLKCYEAFLSSDAQWALILEDDAELPGDLQLLLKRLTSNAGAWRVDIFNMGPVRKFVHRVLRQVLAYRLVDPVRIWNAHAYLINRDAARAMLLMNSPVRYMADDWAAFRDVASVRLAALDPFPCAQAAEFVATGLEQDRQRARKVFLPWGRHRFLYLCVKLRRRLSEIKRAFCKRVYSH
jgi:glycosyl transferase family 25